MRHLLLTEADTAVVIASDGMTDVMSDQDAADVILGLTREKVKQLHKHLHRCSQASALINESSTEMHELRQEFLPLFACSSLRQSLAKTIQAPS